MNWIDTNTLITICTCAVGLTQFFLWRYIAKNQAYEAEKGKNLATKEDIGEISLIAEKAKNTATKEDIEEITQKIEAVKSGFTTETEQLKSLLTIESKAKTQLIYKQRKALEDFWGKYHIWYNSYSGGWRSYNDRIDVIQDLLNNAEKHYHDCEVAYHNLSLYFNDNIFLDETRKLIYRTSELLFDIEDIIKKIQSINLTKGDPHSSSRINFLSMIPEKNQKLLKDETINLKLEIFKKEAKKYILGIQ